MSRPRLAPAVIVFLASLAAPGVANAGIIDFIWEMSGPQMIGVQANCEFDLRQGGHQCRLVDKIHLSGDRNFRINTDRSRVWLTLTGAAYFSTTKDSDTNEFGWWTVKMLAYEPTLDVRSYNGTKLKLDHGVMGLSYVFLIGSKFKNFDNVGVKLVPVTATIGNVTVAYNFRIFPNGFTSEQFGGDPEPVAGRRSELVHGITFGYVFGR